MTHYLVEPKSWKRTVKPTVDSWLSLACCVTLALGGLLVANNSEAFREGDRVVVQNTFLDGLEVWNIPNLQPDTVFDGTRGTILSEPVVPTANSYKVRWDTLPEIMGWSVATIDGCKVIGTAEEANQRDKIVAKLFDMNLSEVDAQTLHEYNGYGCNSSWEENDQPVYNGGHSGWDVQTDSTFDSDRNNDFYSLTKGRVIRADEGTASTSSVIAVYSEENEKITTLYLHARKVYVKMNQDVEVGHLLGKQGNTGLNQSNDTDRSHVHIEVGETTQPSSGTDDERNQTTDPIPYLYASVNAAEQQHLGRGGDGQQSHPDVNQDRRVDIIDLLLIWASIGKDVQSFPQADVNHDGVIDKADIVEVAKSLDDPEDTAAPTSFARNQVNNLTIHAGQAYIGDILVPREAVQALLNTVHEADDSLLVFKRSITMLESILAAMPPNKTALFTNYPNPFNPETWIPYQLAEAGDVTLTIYAADGKLIRFLTLGHQPAGIYQSRSRAAYWNGRNAQGELVASGVYFYTLSTVNFTATRKMVIRK